MPKDLHLSRQLRGEHSKTDFTTVGEQQGFVTKEPKKKPVDPISTRTAGEEAHDTAEAWRLSTRGGNKRKSTGPTKKPARKEPAPKKPATNGLANKKPAPPNYFPKNPAQKKPPQGKPARKDPPAQEEEAGQEGEGDEGEEVATGDEEDAQQENAALQGEPRQQEL